MELTKETKKGFKHSLYIYDSLNSERNYIKRIKIQLDSECN